MKLLIGTQNPGKFGEMGKFLGSAFEFVSLADVGKPIIDIAETAATFQENAILKAKAYYAWSHIPSVADDAGLEIDALGGQPGVMSRRWPMDGEVPPYREKTDEEMIALALSKLQGVPWEKRTAHLRMVCAYYDGKSTLTWTAAIKGFITEQQEVPHRKGYPFRSIFWVPQFETVYENLTQEQHEAVNHRREAYAKLRDLILDAVA